MVFPKTMKWEESNLKNVKVNSIQELEKLICKFPYKIYCVMDEKIEKHEPTTFLVVYVSSESNYILMVDLSNQVNSTINLDDDAVKNGYYEFIDVGIIEQYSLAFYVRS